MLAAALAATRLVLWREGSRRPGSLLAPLMALGAGSAVMTDLALMNAESVERYATLVRVQNVAVYMTLVPMVWLVHQQCSPPAAGWS